MREKIATADEAARWIRDYLKDGPRPVPYQREGHISQAPLAGQAVRNVKTKAFRVALRHLKVRTLKTGPHGGACWHLPEQRTLKPPASVDFSTLETEVLALWEKDNESAEALGHALIKLRDVFKRRPGNANGFAEWLRKHKMDRNRANYCIRVANGKHAAAKKKKEIPVRPTAQLAALITKDISQCLAEAYAFNSTDRAEFARAAIGNSLGVLYREFCNAQIFVDHHGNAEVEAAYLAVESALEKLVAVAVVKKKAPNKTEPQATAATAASA